MPRPNPSPAPADKDGSSLCRTEDGMNATITEIREARRQIIQHEQAIKKLLDRIDELLGLNFGRRAPKRRMLTHEQAGALFADIERTAHERSKTQ